MSLIAVRITVFAVMVFVLSMGVFSPPVSALDDPAAAREIMAKHADAVVTIRLVIKMQMSMRGQAAPNEEMKLEVRGTTIDASGLTVLSLSEVNPEEIMNRMGFDEEYGFQVTAETTDVKIRLANGSEIPAKVVLRDNDLDLAFVRPVQKLANPVPFVDLSDSSKLNMLDPILILGRLGKVASRVPCAAIERVHAVIPKPRTLYVPGAESQNSTLGVPVFAMNGKVAGLMVMRMSPAGADSGVSSYMQDSSDDYIMVILPAEDVLEIAKQAPEQAAEEVKPAASEPAEQADAEPETEE